MATHEEVKAAEARMNQAKNELLAYISFGQHDSARRNELIEELDHSMYQFLRLIRELVL
jgi:hypothetical protein